MRLEPLQVAPCSIFSLSPFAPSLRVFLNLACYAPPLPPIFPTFAARTSFVKKLTPHALFPRAPPSVAKSSSHRPLVHAIPEYALPGTDPPQLILFSQPDPRPSFFNALSPGITPLQPTWGHHFRRFSGLRSFSAPSPSFSFPFLLRSRSRLMPCHRTKCWRSVRWQRFPFFLARIRPSQHRLRCFFPLACFC